jgi:uncharacterized protein YgiM (DUF1202 family)
MKLSSCLSGSLLVLLALCGTSCSTPESAAPAAASNSGQYYVVSAREAKFFRYGPQQASGPDEKLAQGTLVTLIRPTFGYRKVQLSNGLQGYVASQDIHAAPPEVVQAATNPNPTVSGTSEPNRNRRSRDSMVDPRFLPPPPALPEDQPEPTPIPGSEQPPTP